MVLDREIGAGTERRLAVVGARAAVDRRPCVAAEQAQRAEDVGVLPERERRARGRVEDRPEARVQRLRRRVHERDVRDVAVARREDLLVETGEPLLSRSVALARDIDGAARRALRVLAEPFAQRDAQMVVQAVGIARHAALVVGRLLKADPVDGHQARLGGHEANVARRAAPVGDVAHSARGGRAPSTLPGVNALRFPPVLAAWAHVAAELVNTRPRETDPPEKLVGPDDLQRLLALCPEPAARATEADLAPVRALRTPLLRAFEASTPGAFAAAVNPLLARARAGWQMAPGAGGAWALGPAGDARLADWLGAHAARGLAELVIAYGVERLHVCAADDCACAAVDVSRNGTRRFCSRTCANRTNVRRHRSAV
jgi:predicted RNA-binding Zn ribbon-like protein